MRNLIKISTVVLNIVIITWCTLHSAYSQEHNILEILRYGWKKNVSTPAVWRLVHSKPQLSINNSKHEFLTSLFRNCASGKMPHLKFAKGKSGLVICENEEPEERKFSWTIRNNQLLIADPFHQKFTHFNYEPYPDSNRIIIGEQQTDRSQKVWQIIVELEPDDG